MIALGTDGQSRTHREEQGRLRSVSIAVDVLDCFDEHVELGVSEIARQLGIAKSTAFRTLGTLEARGLVDRTPSGRYRLGLRLFLYGQTVIARLTLRELGLPVLAELRNRLSETVQLGLPMGAEVLYVDRLEGIHGLRFHTEYFRRVPGHSSSSGKAMAAFSPFLARMVRSAGLRQWTPHTIVDPRKYQEVLAETRRRGWACSEEEFEVGLSSVAAPVLVHHHDGIHVVAALSVAGPTQRILGVRERVITQSVVHAARKLSAAVQRAGAQPNTYPVDEYTR